jgi:hypothetical protein
MRIPIVQSGIRALRDSERVIGAATKARRSARANIDLYDVDLERID